MDFDGTWVAHPDLVPVAMAEFDRVLGNRPNQKSAPGDPSVPASALLDIVVPGGRTTEAGARQDISVTLRYLDAWLRGNGAAAIDNLMEDAATAEISRSQLWQWRRHGTLLDDGSPFDDARYARIRDEELTRIGRDTGRVAEAAELLDGLVLTDDFPEFLTLEAYRRLEYPAYRLLIARSEELGPKWRAPGHSGRARRLRSRIRLIASYGRGSNGILGPVDRS